MRGFRCSAGAKAAAGLLVLGASLLGLPAVGSAQNLPAVDTPFKEAPRPIIGALREPLEDLPQVENFTLVGHTVIRNPGERIERGRNGAVSLAPPCAYVGNRLGRRSGTGPDFDNTLRDPEIAIVDISRPLRPRVVEHLRTPRGGTSRELRAFPELDTLYVQNFGANEEEAGASVNNFMIYDISDCRDPDLKATIDLGEWEPHEFFVWRDPNDGDRVLIYVNGGGSTEPWIRVYDVSNAITGQEPQLVASFTMNPVVPTQEPVVPGQFNPNQFVFADPPTQTSNVVHALSMNRAGTRLYIAGRQSGFYVIDSSKLAAGESCIAANVTVDENTNTNANLCLRKVNPDPDARIDPHPPVLPIAHSATKVPGRPYVLVSGERNGTTTCPWAHGKIIDVTVEAFPQELSPWMVPENLAQNCFPGGPGDPALMREFSTHQILPFRNLFFQSWYSAGLRAWDIANPWLPMETGVFVPKPEFPDVVEPFRDSPDVWMWSYPVLYNGNIYVMDENSGLFILKYTGRRSREVPSRGLFEGNAIGHRGR